MLRTIRTSVTAIVIVIFCVGSSPGQTTNTSNRVLAAEGDFVAQTKDGDRPLSHWKLWHLSDGGYEVVDRKLKNPSSVEIFQFDPQLMPTGFTKRLGALPKTQNHPQMPGITISCQYRATELSCASESSEGKKSTVSIAARAPYVFIGEFYDLNFAWFMTGVVNLSQRNKAGDGLVNVYFLTDGAKPDEIGLEADKPIKVAFIGQEVGEFDGQQQMLKVFDEGQDSFPILRTNAKSIVVSLGDRSNPAPILAIRNYKEYAPWGPAQ